MGRADRLDALDQSIIRCLQRDGRTSYSAMAKLLGVTEGTVRNRLARLLADRVIRVVAVADLFKVGMHAAAITGINVQRNKMKQALSRLMEMTEVRYIAVTTGAFDIIIEVVLPDTDALHDFLVDRLAGVPGLLRTDTSMILKIHKQSYTWLPEPNGARPLPRGAR
ncbi:MAG: Lrp/AsnC family transcriptional regulator [Armatimonadota bacterium]|nr:Lrp/AsnC family transcriptional regulator [Armatimonadota bacterium]MDR7519298.1 Lrp/AsnC family transcriptional regulator [Armatimonadota bacterium]MDR7549285.1 Lrp/AsnC family transcriptional regulator [Armatimonadota bacterium]